MKRFSNLISLDLRSNDFPKLKDVLDILSQSTPSLETLNLEHVTKTRETAVPREYAFSVCKVLRHLHTLDGIKNPFGAPIERKKKVEKKEKTSSSDRKAARVRSEMKLQISGPLPPMNPQILPSGGADFLDDASVFQDASKISPDPTELYKGQIESE